MQLKLKKLLQLLQAVVAGNVSPTEANMLTSAKLASWTDEEKLILTDCGNALLDSLVALEASEEYLERLEKELNALRAEETLRKLSDKEKEKVQELLQRVREKRDMVAKEESEIVKKLEEDAELWKALDADYESAARLRPKFK